MDCIKENHDDKVLKFHETFYKILCKTSCLNTLMFINFSVFLKYDEISKTVCLVKRSSKL